MGYAQLPQNVLKRTSQGCYGFTLDSPEIHWVNQLMNKTDRFFQSALLFLLMIFLSCSCGSHSPPIQPEATSPVSANCRMIAHAKGQTEICGVPRQVAALSPYILDMMLSLGVEPAGYSAADVTSDLLRQSKFDQPSQQIPYLGSRITTQPVNLGDRHSPSLEALAQLDPDVILGEDWQGSQSQYELLSQIAPTVLVDDEAGGWQQSIRVVAQVLDRAAQLEQTMAEYEAHIAEVRQQLAPVTEKYPRVLLLSSGNLKREIRTYYCSEFSRLLKALGFQLVRQKGNSPECSSQLSVEVLPQLNADIIMVVAYDETEQGDDQGWQARRREWSKIPTLQQMPVTRAGRVYFIDARLSTMRGPLAANVILELYLDRLAPLIR